MPRATKEPLIVPVTDEDVMLSNIIQNINGELQAKYPEAFYNALVNVCYEISRVGLPVQEACLMWDVDYEKFLSIMQADPLVKKLIDKKTLEYKRELLKILSAQVIQDKNGKTAMDILSARFPDEFNRRKGSGDGSGTEQNNLVVNAISFVQNGGDSNPLISGSRNQARIITPEDEEKKRERKGIMERLATLLN